MVVILLVDKINCIVFEVVICFSIICSWGNFFLRGIKYFLMNIFFWLKILILLFVILLWSNRGKFICFMVVNIVLY